MTSSFESELETLVSQDCTTEDAFERMLSVLLVGAYNNGIDISGAWEAHDYDHGPEWDVVVTELVRESEAQSDCRQDGGDQGE